MSDTQVNNPNPLNPYFAAYNVDEEPVASPVVVSPAPYVSETESQSTCRRTSEAYKTCLENQQQDEASIPKDSLVSHKVSEISSISQPTLSQVEQLKKKCAESYEVRRLIGAHPSIDIERLIQDKGGEEWAGKVNIQLAQAMKVESLKLKLNPGRVFFNAVENNHVELVQFLIAAHGPALANGLYMKDGGDSLRGKGMTVLMHAAENDNSLMMESLLSANIPSGLLNQCDSEGHSALMHAVEKGNLTNMNALLRAGGNLANMEEALLEEINKPGNFELLIKGGGVPSTDNSRIINALLKYIDMPQGIDVRLIEPMLLLAAEHGFVDVVIALFDKRVPLFSYFSDIQKNKALMLAAKNGHADVVRVLPANSTGIRLALSLAAKNGHSDVVKVLFNKDVTFSTEDKNKALMLAAKNGHFDIVELFLSKDVSFSASHKALMLAAKHGHVEVVKFLIKSGYIGNEFIKIKNIFTSVVEGGLMKEDQLNIIEVLVQSLQQLIPHHSHLDFISTALLFAVNAGDINKVKAFEAAYMKAFEVIQFQNEGNVDPGMVGIDYPMLLLCAAREGRLNIVDYFIDKHIKFDQNVKNSALALAAGAGQMDVVITLLKSDAEVTKEAIQAVVYAGNKEVLDALLKTADKEMIAFAQEMANLLQKAQDSEQAAG